MHSFLVSNNYEQPNIKLFRKNDISVSLLKFENFQYRLCEGETQWMTYDLNHRQALEISSHFYLAKGHCICTGLGFGARENWVLKKPEVTKLTVLEKNVNIIEYNRYINPKLMSEIEIINTDADEYIGKCDTLLLDHYEMIEYPKLFKRIDKISKNIKCETLWFWPIERILLEIASKNKNFKLKDIYKNMILSNNLQNMPILNEQILQTFVRLFQGKDIDAEVAQW